MTKKPSETRGKSKSTDAGRKPAPAKKTKAGAAVKPAKSTAKPEMKPRTKPPKDAKAPKAAPSSKSASKVGAKPAQGAAKTPVPKGAAVKPGPAKVEGAKSTSGKPAKPGTKAIAEPKPGAGPGKGKPGVKAHESKTGEPKSAGVKGSDGMADEKSGRKGITVVTPKRPRPARARAAQTLMPAPATLTRLPRHPLIPSGPNAKVRAPLDEADPSAKKKSPFNKTQLEKFRKTLLQKRADLVSEIAGLEQEALRTSSGSLSHTPSHMAEQGTETAEQSLSLDLAATERKLIREIDDAVKRVDDGTFGLCELTGRPIPADRLEELPWTRYSIDAARELERRHYHR